MFLPLPPTPPLPFFAPRALGGPPSPPPPRRRSRRTRLSVLSLATATCSFLLGSVALALSVHSGFLTLDPRWSHLYEAGLLLAFLALLIGLVGAKDSNPVRWQAPTVSLGCIFLWFLAGSGS